MTLGNNIKKYRKEAKLTQVELAKKLGVEQNHVHRWESDKIIPSLETIKKLALSLNISIDGLLFTEEERTNLNISDKDLIERLKDIEQLEPEDKKAVIRLINAFRKQ